MFSHFINLIKFLFHDKSTTTQNPINNYSESGTFTVILTVKDENDSTDIETKENYIMVNEVIGIDDNKHDEGKIFVESYPNPFKNITTIRYRLFNNSFVTVKIFDILGNEITTLINSKQSKGSYNVIWNPQNQDGASLPLGIYYYHITTKSGSEMETITGKMVMIK